MATDSVSAELSSTGTILETPVELKVTHLRNIFYSSQISCWPKCKNWHKNKLIKTNLEVFYLLSEQH